MAPDPQDPQQLFTEQLLAAGRWLGCAQLLRFVSDRLAQPGMELPPDLPIPERVTTIAELGQLLEGLALVFDVHAHELASQVPTTRPPISRTDPV